MTTKRLPTSSASRFVAGTVVVVPFPYSDRLSEKRRPALVVSAPELARTGVIWVLMITTAKRGLGAHDIPIEDLSAAGLHVPCVVRPTKIACIDPDRVLRLVGSLRPETAGAVFKRVRAFVATDRPTPISRTA